MMKMRIVVLTALLSCLGFNVVNAQESGSTESAKPDYMEYQSWSLASSAGIFIGLEEGWSFYSFGFAPRYNFIAPKPYLSVSAGVPLNLGIDFLAGAGGSLFRFMTDVPLTIDLNFGAKATPFDESLVGGYIGGGIGYNWMHFSLNGEKANFHNIGPVVHAAFKWRYYGRVTGLRVSYLQGINTGQVDETGEAIPGNRVLSVSLIYSIN